jgi:hypothetical protein
LHPPSAHSIMGASAEQRTGARVPQLAGNQPGGPEDEAGENGRNL